MELRKLIERLKAEDKVAAKQLYQETYRILYAIALRYVTYDEKAKDVLQNTYINIFNSLAKVEFDSDAAVMGWMKKVCVNEALKFLNKRKIWKRNSEVLEKNYTVGNNHQLYKDELFKILLKLPEKQRIVFSLFVIDGYSHKEISGQLGITETNSRTLISRAKSFLSEHITKEMVNEIA